jgi:hypothetical protein
MLTMEGVWGFAETAHDSGSTTVRALARTRLGLEILDCKRHLARMPDVLGDA